MRRVGNLFECPHVLKSCFNAYVLSSLEHWAPVWMLSAESHLGLVDRVVRSADKCEDEHCYMEHRKRSESCVCCIILITDWTTL